MCTFVAHGVVTSLVLHQQCRSVADLDLSSAAHQANSQRTHIQVRKLHGDNGIFCNEMKEGRELKEGRRGEKEGRNRRDGGSEWRRGERGGGGRERGWEKEEEEECRVKREKEQ